MLLVVLRRAHFDQMAIFHVIQILNRLPSFEKSLLGFSGDCYILSILSNNTRFLFPIGILNRHWRNTGRLIFRRPINILRLILRGNQRFGHILGPLAGLTVRLFLN